MAHTLQTKKKAAQDSNMFGELAWISQLTFPSNKHKKCPLHDYQFGQCTNLAPTHILPNHRPRQLS